MKKISGARELCVVGVLLIAGCTSDPNRGGVFFNEQAAMAHNQDLANQQADAQSAAQAEQAKTSSLQESRADLEAKMAAYNQTVAAQNAELASLQQQVSHMQGDTSALQSQLAQTQTNVTSLQNDDTKTLDQKVAEAARLKAEIKALRQQILQKGSQ